MDKESQPLPNEYVDFEKIRTSPVYRMMLVIDAIGYLTRNQIIQTPQERTEAIKQIRNIETLTAYLQSKGLTEHLQKIVSAADQSYKDSKEYYNPGQDLVQ